MKQSEIKFTVTLDDKNMPQKIDWSATDGGVDSTSKAIMLSVWDAEENNTLRIDLWTKDMMVDEMKQFYHQSLLSMADTLGALHRREGSSTGHAPLRTGVRRAHETGDEKPGLLSGAEQFAEALTVRYCHKVRPVHLCAHRVGDRSSTRSAATVKNRLA